MMHQIFTGALLFASLAFLIQKPKLKEKKSKQSKRKKGKPEPPTENSLVWTTFGIGLVKRMLPGEWGKIQLEVKLSSGVECISKYHVHPIVGEVFTPFGDGYLLSVSEDEICEIDMGFGAVYCHFSMITPKPEPVRKARKRKIRENVDIPHEVTNLLLEGMYAVFRDPESACMDFIRRKRNGAVLGLSKAIIEAIVDQSGPTCGAHSLSNILTAIGTPRDANEVLFKHYVDFQQICVTKLKQNFEIIHTTKRVGNLNIQKAARRVRGVYCNILLDTRELNDKERAWKILVRAIQKPKTGLLFHTTNHYVPIAGYLEFGRERYILASKRGQKPTTLIHFDEMCEVISSWKGYKILKIFRTS